jgi:hypothetical protein
LGGVGDPERHSPTHGGGTMRATLTRPRAKFRDRCKTNSEFLTTDFTDFTDKRLGGVGGSERQPLIGGRDTKRAALPKIETQIP